MLKKAKLSYRGINQDVSKSKRSPEFYFDAQNIRILATDNGTTGSITNDKGNALAFTIISGQIIIGHAVLKDYIVLFVTNGNGIDSILRINISTNSQDTLYYGNLNFKLSNLIETEVYYESDDIQKVYWVDGLNQLRHINIIMPKDINGYDRAYTLDEAVLFDSVPEVVFSAPYVDSVDYGGIHTAGMIQYAYNLIKQNGSQSAISPISSLYPLGKNVGGGKVNEYVGKILNIKIDLVDIKYDIIRLYAIKFTSYNEPPSINIIAEETIGGNISFTYADDGRIIRAVNADQFLFLGGIAFIPSTITSKYNRLILGNIRELYFDVPIFSVDSAFFDTRAYRFPISSNSTKIKNYNDISDTDILHDGTKIVTSLSNELIGPEHDAINSDFYTYNYKRNTTAIGASGTNIDIQIVQQSLDDPRNVLKSNETYRFGIEFYNNRGQTSPPKWICDLKIPQGNINGLYNTLFVTLRNSSVLASLGVVGWRVLRVDRTDADKTILCQGIVSSMVFQRYDDADNDANLANGVAYADEDLLKIPSPFIRNTTKLSETWVNLSGEQAPYIYPIKHGEAIGTGSNSTKTDDPRQEFFRDDNGSKSRIHLTFEETRLMQLFSPEITFGDVNVSDNLDLRFNHYVTNDISSSASWAKQYNTDNGLLNGEVKRNAKLSLYKDSKEHASAFHQYSRIGGSGDHNLQNKYQYYRNYSFGNFIPESTYDILGSPILTGVGETGFRYNNTSKYQFTNLLGTLLTDRNRNGSDDPGDDGIISVNSMANRNLTFMVNDETKLETIMATATAFANAAGIFEIIRFVTNQYGGNTYEARSRNSYLRIGRYSSVLDTVDLINSAGDTFVGKFRFARILGGTTSVQNSKYYEMTEIVEFPVETSIDLSHRSDLSTAWDSIFMPTFDEYHNYNKVYSQQPIFNRTTATPFTFQERKVFDNRINATKVKTNGEIVDSWTDILINEELYVDGKYGSITEIIQNNDIVYCLQEQAVSILEIQPRVQTVATDGTTIELGRGSVLYNYRYLNTNSGCVNQQSVFQSQNSVYYIDVANKSINRIVGSDVTGLTDIYGLHSYMFNNLDYITLKNSNLVTGCFDQVSNDAYFTTPTFTISFNEQTNSFTSRYSFIPKRYIYTHRGLFSTANGSTLWRHGVGLYGSYYGTIYPSYITLLAVPEPDTDCVFNNGEYKSEVYTGSSDVSTKTLTSIECWNEYQNSGVIPLVVGGNIRRKFRDWNFFIPRSSANILQRMRGQWLYMKLGFDNTLNERLVLHDTIIGYEAVNKI